MRGALSLCAAVFTLGVGCAASTADEATSGEDAIKESAPPRILALGDSITFAWDPNLEKDPHKVDPKNYAGYAELLGARRGAVVDNAACPGEASGSMLDARAEDNGCDENRAAYSLHYPWSKPTGATPATQGEFVVSYLEKAIASGHPPELVTLTMGGNDLLIIQNHCALGILTGGCELVRLPFAVHAFGEHIDRLLGSIYGTGYRGTVALLSLYAPDYSDALATLGVTQINGELAEHARKAAAKLSGMRIRFADGYAAFKARADAHGGKSCEAGLLIKNPDGKTCDFHPSAAGHAVLADAVEAALRAE